MTGARYSGGKKRGGAHRITKRDIVKYVIFILLLSILSVMQTSFVKINGNPVGITLLFVSAVGMLYGERDGGMTGLIGGLLIDCLGGGIIYISPLIYALVGYFCGVTVSKILSSNLPSYIVYMLIVGIVKEAQNLFYYVMLSDNLNLVQIFIDTLLPDYVAFIIFSPVIYGVTYLTYKITNYKKNKKY